MDAKAEKIALFRYALIAPLVLEPLAHGELTRRAQEIAARPYEIPASRRTSVSVDSLLHWALRYRQGGFEALAPKPRQDRGQSRTITPQLADLIERLKRENPHRTGTTLLRELALVSGQNQPALSAATLYRFHKQRGRGLGSPPSPAPARQDLGKFKASITGEFSVDNHSCDELVAVGEINRHKRVGPARPERARRIRQADVPVIKGRAKRTHKALERRAPVPKLMDCSLVGGLPCNAVVQASCCLPVLAPALESANQFSNALRPGGRIRRKYAIEGWLCVAKHAFE